MSDLIFVRISCCLIIVDHGYDHERYYEQVNS